MGFQISVEPSGHVFEANEDEALLDAALRQGLMMPYGCRSGACGACRGKVLSGRIEHGDAQEFALPEKDRAAGFALLCCASAKSDLVIEAHEVRGTQDIPVKTLPAKIHRLTRAAPDVMIVELKLPAN